MRMTRRAVATCLILCACTGASPSGTASVPTSPAPSIGPAAGAGELELPALVAELFSDPGPWTEVLVVPFGSSRQQLGFEQGSGATLRGPTSFAVLGGPAPNVWIADPLKHRLIRYGLADGAVLDEVHVPRAVPLGDLLATRGPHPEVWAVLDGARGTIAQVNPQGIGKPVAVGDAGIRYRVDGLVADHARVVAEVRGGGQAGFARLDTQAGRVTRWEPGVRAGGPVSLDLRTGAEELDLHWFHYQHELATGVAPIHLRGAPGSSSSAVIDARLQGTALGGAIAWLHISLPGGTGGSWILAVPPDPSSAMLFERLPEGGVASGQVRSLAVGPDGRLWLMVTEADGVHLFRRRTPAGA